MPRAVKMSADEARWRAEDDARTLKRAEEIRNDKSRMKMATSQIQKEFQATVKVVQSLGITKEAKATSKTTPKKQTAKKK
jgi:hypothetical protein